MWFFYSLFFAIWTAIATLLIKRFTEKIAPLPLFFILSCFTVPAIFILLLFVGGVPKVTSAFYVNILLSALLDTVGFISAFYALSISEISLLAPISSFTPVFTTLIAASTLNEIPTLPKLIGILIIVFGAYLLNIKDIKKGIFVPLKTLFTHRGVLLTLLSSLIWAITPIFQKKAIFETFPQTPLYASLIGLCFVTLFIAPFALKKSISYKNQIFKHTKLFLFFGAGGAFSQLAAFTAFSLAYLGYVTAIFRLSALFTILLGAIVLKEGRIKEKLVGAAVMLLGTILLAV